MKNASDYSGIIPPDFEVISRLVIQCDGRIRFTPFALNLVKPILGYHGIDVRNIKTVDQYKDACSRILDNVALVFAESTALTESGADFKKIVDDLFAEPEKSECQSVLPD